MTGCNRVDAEPDEPIPAKRILPVSTNLALGHAAPRGPTAEAGCEETVPGTLADGLYRVTTTYLCAGFAIEGGRVTLCAPILRKRFTYWRTIAQRVT